MKEYEVLNFKERYKASGRCREYVRVGRKKYACVTRWTTKDGKPRMTVHYISFLKGGFCDCKGYQYSKGTKWCRHIRDIIAEEKKGGGIIRDSCKEDFDWKYLKVK